MRGDLIRARCGVVTLRGRETVRADHRLRADEKHIIAVETAVTRCPPHRSRRARFTHRAPTLGVWRRSVHPAKGEGYAQGAGTRRRADPCPSRWCGPVGYGA